MDEKLGQIKISDEVISICAVNAAMNTPGVFSLSGGFIDNISRNLKRQEAATKGIKLSRNENECEIDVNLITEYNTKIPQVAWDVQVNVKNEVEGMTGITVNAVNIHVQGVHIEDEEENND